jgi:uncharacterized protein YdhG (YjbR/CyaY superfamily)
MMPAFKQHGILVYFAAWEKHIGMYPPISGHKTLEKAIARYAGPSRCRASTVFLLLTPSNVATWESELKES